MTVYKTSLGRYTNPRAGFSLMQMSVILAGGALIIAAVLPGGEAGSDADKTRTTLERMQKIEEATQRFMTANQRRPFPSDLKVNSSSSEFGKEITPPYDYSSDPAEYFAETITPASTSCDGTTLVTVSSTTGLQPGWLAYHQNMSNAQRGKIQIDQIIDGTTLRLTGTVYDCSFPRMNFRSPIVAGGVPTTALGLPHEFAQDGYGRRFTYMVDQRATIKSTCALLQNKGIPGAVEISSSNNFSTNSIDRSMYALLSYGKDGHGAMSVQGSNALDTRINTGITDVDTLNNAFYTSAASPARNYNTVRGLVKKEHTTSFDDIVWYDTTYKDTCAMGHTSSVRDFMLSAGAGASVSLAEFGDVNGDGYADMILSKTGDRAVQVVFGKGSDWPEPPENYDLTNIAAGEGFTITLGGISSEVSGSFPNNIVVGDINGDGYDDIILGGTPVNTNSTGYAVIFGKAAFAESISLDGLTGHNGFRITHMSTTGQAHDASVGDLNNDGYADIFIAPNKLVFGKASGWAATLNLSTITSPAGMTFNVANPNNANGKISYGTGTLWRKLSAFCDVNNDQIDDLLLPGVDAADGTTTPQRVYLVYGTTSTIPSDPSTSFQYKFPNTSATHQVQALGCADINPSDEGRWVGSGGMANVDRYGEDAVFYTKANSGDGAYMYIELGANEGQTSVEVDSASYYDARIDMTTATAAPSWQDNSGAPVIRFGDVNNDGRKEILLSSKLDNVHYTVNSDELTVNHNSSSGLTRANSGMGYVISPPSTYSAQSLNFNALTFTHHFFGAADDEIIIRAAGDVNRDGLNDLLITKANYGGAFLVFGKRNWNKANTYDLECIRNPTSADYCKAQLNAR